MDGQAGYEFRCSRYRRGERRFDDQAKNDQTNVRMRSNVQYITQLGRTNEMTGKTDQPTRSIATQVLWPPSLQPPMNLGSNQVGRSRNGGREDARRRTNEELTLALLHLEQADPIRPLALELPLPPVPAAVAPAAVGFVDVPLVPLARRGSRLSVLVGPVDDSPAPALAPALVSTGQSFPLPAVLPFFRFKWFSLGIVMTASVDIFSMSYPEIELDLRGSLVASY